MPSLSGSTSNFAERLLDAVIDACKVLGTRYRPARVYLGQRELAETFADMRTHYITGTKERLTYDKFIEFVREGDVNMNTFSGPMVIIPVDLETHLSIGGDRIK